MNFLGSLGRLVPSSHPRTLRSSCPNHLWYRWRYTSPDDTYCRSTGTARCNTTHSCTCNAPSGSWFWSNTDTMQVFRGFPRPIARILGRSAVLSRRWAALYHHFHPYAWKISSRWSSSRWSGWWRPPNSNPWWGSCLWDPDYLRDGEVGRW